MEVMHGDALSILKQMEPCAFDAVITDPPYSSGGLHIKDRSKPTGTKYFKGTHAPDFSGDNMDGRSWRNWAQEWLSECLRVTKPGSPLVVFCDWRQIPSLTDAVQWAGWTWRGIAVWDKGNARPQPGRFRQQAEFLVWGSNGAMPVKRNAPVLPGVLLQTSIASTKRLHQTEKPLELMRKIVGITEKGGCILDPFAGSGATLEAAALEGYDAVGIEKTEVFYKVAKERIACIQYALQEV